jgi:nicotinic acid mononucleotide adenylyltransferase
LRWTGTDTYRDLKDGKWKRGFDLKQRVSLVVVARPGVHFMASTQDLSDPR